MIDTKLYDIHAAACNINSICDILTEIVIDEIGSVDSANKGYALVQSIQHFAQSIMVDADTMFDLMAKNQVSNPTTTKQFATAG